MTTTVFVDSGSTSFDNVPTFTRVLATETDTSTDTAVSLVKRVTGDSTIDNDKGGPGILFSRGYGTTNANDTPFALIGASYTGSTDIHEIRLNTSTNGGSSFNRLLTISTANADFNMPVGMNAYADLTAINAIANPVAGMVVYNTDTETLYVYSGTQWNDVGVNAQTAYTLPAATSSSLGGVIIPAVGTSGITNSSGTIGLATASTTQLGAVKVDGSTVTINGSGVISANTSYTLPTASTTVLGGVKVDGTTITIDGGGVITSNSTSTLNGLTDVTITGTPVHNQILSYNNGTSQWENRSTMTTNSGATTFAAERQTTAAQGGSTSLFGAIRVIRRITDATTGYDEGGASIVFQSVGTSNVFKSNALIGAYNNTGDVSDFAVQTSNDGGTTYAETFVSSRSRTNINQGLLYVDKTNSRVGINDTTPEYALDVTGQVRATSGFIGNLTGNADTVTNGVVTTGSYADPTWITSLAYSKITGAPSVTTTLDGLTDVTITNAQKGKFLIRGATDWVDTSLVEFDNTSYRPKFVNNANPGSAGVNSSAEFLKNTGDAPAAGDGTGILFGAIQTNGTKKLTNRMTSVYETSEAHKVYIQSSNDSFVNNSVNLALFASDGSQVYSDLTVSGGLTVDNGTLTVDKTNNRVGVNITSPNFTLDVGGSSYVSGYATFGNDIEIQGGDLVTNQTTFNLINTNATTVNFAGAATTVNIGNASGNVVFANTISTTGNATVGGTLKITGEEIKDAAGTTRIEMNPTGLNGTTKITGGAWVTGNLQVDGTVNFASFNPSTLSTTTLSVADGGSFTVAGTSPSTFNGIATFNKSTYFNAPQLLDSRGAGNINTNEALVYLPSGSSSSSLFDGTIADQIRYMVNEGGSKTVYVGTAGWKGGTNGQINFTGQGGVLFIWMGSSGGGWHVIAGRNYTLT